MPLHGECCIFIVASKFRSSFAYLHEHTLCFYVLGEGIVHYDICVISRLVMWALYLI